MYPLLFLAESLGWGIPKLGNWDSKVGERRVVSWLLAVANESNQSEKPAAYDLILSQKLIVWCKQKLANEIDMKDNGLLYYLKTRQE